MEMLDAFSTTIHIPNISTGEQLVDALEVHTLTHNHPLQNHWHILNVKMYRFFIHSRSHKWIKLIHPPIFIQASWPCYMQGNGVENVKCSTRCERTFFLFIKAAGAQGLHFFYALFCLCSCWGASQIKSGPASHSSSKGRGSGSASRSFWCSLRCRCRYRRLYRTWKTGTGKHVAWKALTFHHELLTCDLEVLMYWYLLTYDSPFAFVCPL